MKKGNVKKKRRKWLCIFLLTGLAFCQQGCGESSTQETDGQSAQKEEVQEQGAEQDTVEKSELKADQEADIEKNTQTESEKEKQEALSSGLACPSVNGALHVEGTRLVDRTGTPVQLRGISTHGIAWFPDYVNAQCFGELHEQWKANVIRLAMYTAEYGGYCTGGEKEHLKELIRNGVRYAAEQDMYVIVDWHILSDADPNIYMEEAKSFFAEIAGEYADADHILYEICNEPNGSTDWNAIKRYALEVIPVIRAQDSDAVILVGTPNWSQFVDQAAADPITEYENLMYTLHFYAATHTDDLRQKMQAAVENGLPVFVSEYGICDASGNGGIDEAQADLWVEAMDRLGISYVAWNLSNKEESSAMLQSSCGKTNGFVQEDLSASGKWLYRMLTEAEQK